MRAWPDDPTSGGLDDALYILIFELGSRHEDRRRLAFICVHAAPLEHMMMWTDADNDESVDFGGGEASRDHWIDANGCNPDEVVTVSAEAGVSYNGCDPGYPVRWCVHQRS